MTRILFLFLSFFFSLPAYAQDAPEPEAPAAIDLPAEGQEAGYVVEAVRGIVAKFKAKEYGPAFAALIMLLLVAANLLMARVGKEIKKAYLPTLSVITGIGAAIALKIGALAAGAGVWDWATAIGWGAMIGMGATGAWEWFGKKLFKKLLAKTKEKATG